MLKQLLRDRDRGATAIEYGLMIGLIAVVIVVAVMLLGRSTLSLFDKTASTAEWAASQGG